MSDPFKELEKKNHFIVTIAYKSGNKVTARFSEFSVKAGTWSWTGEPNKKYPAIPLELGVGNIESVWYEIE